MLIRIAAALERIAQNLHDVTMIDSAGDAFILAYDGDGCCKPYDMDEYAAAKQAAKEKKKREAERAKAMGNRPPPLPIPGHSEDLTPPTGKAAGKDPSNERKRDQDYTSYDARRDSLSTM